MWVTFGAIENRVAGAWLVATDDIPDDVMPDVIGDESATIWRSGWVDVSRYVKPKFGH